jgi:hypothetical protein
MVDWELELGDWLVYLTFLFYSSCLIRILPRVVLLLLGLYAISIILISAKKNHVDCSTICITGGSQLSTTRREDYHTRDQSETM